MSWIQLAKYAAWGIVTAIVAGVILGGTWMILRNIRLIVNPPPPPPVDRLGPFVVSDVPTGGSVVVKAGWRGRKPQTWKPMYLEAPAEGQPCFQESRDSMKALAGAEILVEIESARILDREKNNVVATLFGESGQNLAIAQLRAGLGRCEANAMPLLKKAQAEAQEAKRGIWAEGVKAEDVLPDDDATPAHPHPIIRFLLIFWGVVLLVGLLVGAGIGAYLWWRSKQ